MSEPPPITAFRSVPRTGVIYVTTEAGRRGFSPSNPEWCNLGQGQPETGQLPGSPARLHQVGIEVDDQEYAPVAGLWELREAIAAFYNQLFRRGLPSQYTAENVAVSGGGRSALTRAAASLGNIHLGHFLPDYTAYEELLDIFKLFSPTPLLLDADDAYAFDALRLRREIRGRGLGAVLLSNPCNPTGKLVSGDDLGAWVGVARELDCALLIDEFYSHYVWRAHSSEAAPIVSAARYVQDVDRDPVIIFDGLTKNWRYPGWRVTWTVGPKAVIEATTSAGSFLDGGGSRPLQRAAIPLLLPEVALQETAALQRAFREKRERLIQGARSLGMTLDREPDGTFYVWASLAQLPPPLSDGTAFFQAALDQKVIVVPGEFFDVNPGKRRSARLSRFRQHVRLSFGPSLEVVNRALERLKAVVSAAAKR
jgi:N-succinyldiaminopimelate aminotransferase